MDAVQPVPAALVLWRWTCPTYHFPLCVANATRAADGPRLQVNMETKVPDVAIYRYSIMPSPSTVGQLYMYVHVVCFAKLPHFDARCKILYHHKMLLACG